VVSRRGPACLKVFIARSGRRPGVDNPGQLGNSAEGVASLT